MAAPHAGSISGIAVYPERMGELLEDAFSLAEAILEQIADAVIFADTTENDPALEPCRRGPVRLRQRRSVRSSI
jgi:hypothetical protein